MSAETLTWGRLSPALRACGLEIAFAVRGDCLIGTFDCGSDYSGHPDTLHGGIAALCLDETMANLSLALDGVPSISATLELVYRRPARLSAGPFRVHARRDRPSGGSRWTVTGELLLASDEVAVTARGIFLQVTRPRLFDRPSPHGTLPR
jgi:acyl-coenzyme A thioesterase PaaI-like protein